MSDYHASGDEADKHPDRVVPETASRSDDDQAAAPPKAIDAITTEVSKAEGEVIAAPSSTSDSSPSGKTLENKISKKQLKRQMKFEMMQGKKRRRKEQEKALKLERAKAEGRDLEAERLADEERRKDGTGWAKRHQKWLGRLENSSNKFEICLDCSFERQMHPKEITSLAVQMRYCYAANKRSDHPVKMTATSLDGETLSLMEKVSGFDSWMNFGFHRTEKDLTETFTDKSRLVYLTSDATTTLERLEDDKVYIIGGIVDRNRLKRATIDRAEELGIATAKLPIDQYINMTATKVLTCNHVFDLLIQYNAHDQNWKSTFLSVLPARKDINVKKEENEEVQGETGDVPSPATEE